jgi:glycosyltransferase domain-containing protein
MSLESKLTLLVYLKDRAAFTQRLCDYFHLIKYPCHVFFADGSLEDENEKIIASFKNANFSYTYHRYPKDLTLSDFYGKVADAASKITTPYVMPFCNDDFPILDSQLKAVEFLESHNDYVGCNGYQPWFYIHEDSSTPYGQYVFFTNYGFSVQPYHELTYPTYNQDTPSDRINFALRHYIQYYYAIIKTEVFKHSANIIKTMNLSDPFVHEYATSLLPMLQGKIHQIDNAFFIKQCGSSQYGDEVMKVSWFKRLFLDSTVEAWKKLLHFLSDYLSKETQQPYDDIYNELLDSVDAMYATDKRFFELCKLILRDKITKGWPLKIFNRFPWLVDRLNPLFLTKKIPPHFIEDVKKIITSPPR